MRYKKTVLRSLLVFGVLCCHLNVNYIYAAFSSDDAGTSGAGFLKLGAGARVAALGDSFAGGSGTPDNMYWNSAGINNIEKKSASLMHAVWFEDIFYDWIAYVHPTKIGNIGLGIQYLSYGEITGTDETGLEGAKFTPSDLAITVSYARKIKNIPVGMNFKYISSKIKETASAFAVDLGGQYLFMEDKLSLGLAVQNIGTKLTYIDEKIPLPANIKIGAAYKIMDNLLGVTDINFPVDNAMYIGAGVEYDYCINDKLITAFRAGYNTKTKDIDGLKGLAAGLGISYSRYTIDYAFVPFGDLGNTQRISFNTRF